MGYPYFNPPYLQKVDKIEEGNYFVPTHGIELESTQEIEPQRMRMLQIWRLVALAVAGAAMVLLSVAYM